MRFAGSPSGMIWSAFVLVGSGWSRAGSRAKAKPKGRPGVHLDDRVYRWTWPALIWLENIAVAIYHATLGLAVTMCISRTVSTVGKSRANSLFRRLKSSRAETDY